MEQNFEKLYEQVDFDNLPVHVGIIMDGNRRWAKKRKLPVAVGHNEGAKTFEKIAKFASDLGIKVLTVYAFSTENWKRDKTEVDEIMKLLRKFLSDSCTELMNKKIKLKIIGDKSRLDLDIQNQIKDLEEKTKDNDLLHLNIAVNYGGRQEIVFACKNICASVENKSISVDEIDEKLFEDNLYTSGLPDVDLLIRSSGELRISGFLLWQLAYSEFWFDNILWPDFSEADFLRAIIDYQNRNRRFGGK